MVIVNILVKRRKAAGMRALVQLRALADAIRRDDPEDNQTKAFDQACRSNPALWSAVRESGVLGDIAVGQSK